MWTPPDTDDLQLARLPFELSQRAFNDPPEPRSARIVRCGWHGTLLDAESGAFAVVRSGGPLEDLVGERLLVSYFPRFVAVYCHNEADIFEDLSLTRRAFQAIALLANEELTVKVEVLTSAA